MLPEYQEYYHELLSVLASHEDVHKAEAEVIEACFKSSLDYWSRVSRSVRSHGFTDQGEEIRFFKEIKPVFAAFIEYYSYRYHALLFAPANGVADTMRFWRWEERKMKRFYESNQEFCRYMEEGATHRDAEYFLRSSIPPESKHPAGELIHDLDMGLISPMDPLVAIMKAYELYGRYIESKLLEHFEA